MSKYRCDDCGELIEIVPLGVYPKRQRLIIHPDKRTGTRCLGSEKQV